MPGESSPLNPTTRFSNRVENYIKYRPSYPKEIISFLENDLNLQKNQRIADIGSGTGLFAELLLQEKYEVVCIEPNEEMRKAAEKRLSHYKTFSSFSQRAEHTSLDAHSIDLIVVATAFHWMEPVATKKEFKRILKPNGNIVLIWNIRKTDNPFLKEYHLLKQLNSIDPPHNNVNEEIIQAFFAPKFMMTKSFDNVQLLNFEGLKGLLLSSSYIPLPGQDSYDAMIENLVKLFLKYSKKGLVKMEYETKAYWHL